MGESIGTRRLCRHSTSEQTGEKLETVFGSRKETWVARDRGEREFDYIPFCAFGIWYPVNEFPIHKNK